MRLGLPRSALAAAAALTAALAVFASAARADFATGLVTGVSIGSSSDRTSVPPSAAVGEEHTILVSVGMPEAPTTLTAIAAGSGSVTITVPVGVDFVATSIASIGAPVIAPGPTFDQDPTPGNNATADGSGRSAALVFGQVLNPQDQVGTNDFVVFAFRVVVREGAKGPMPIGFDYVLDGTSRGAGEVTLLLADPVVKAAKTISPSSGLEIETPFNVTITVTYQGTSFPTVYGLSTEDTLPKSADMSRVQALEVPAGYAMRISGDRVLFESAANEQTLSGASLVFSYRTELRRDRPTPATFSIPTSARARSIETPFPQGFAVTYVGTATAQATTLDTDRDGLTDRQESLSGTAVADADSDDDGVADGDEPTALEDIDGDGLIGALDPDSDGDGLKDGTELGRTAGVASGAGFAGTDASRGNFVADLDPTTTTAAELADTDGDGLRDGFEDRNRNGRKDLGELDPSDPTDVGVKGTDLPDADGDGVADIFEDVNQNGVVDANETDPGDPADGPLAIDTDLDGVPDEAERFYGLDPQVADLDSDDDGIADLDEPSGFQDIDGDGLFGSTDPDSDNDGIPDGTETGVTTPTASTDPRVFRPDLDPATTTSMVAFDTDRDGVPDGFEDLDQNGRLDAGETDPADGGDGQSIPENLVDSDADGLPDVVEEKAGLDPLDADTDDDGVADGLEPGALVDTDDDGKGGARDPDSDNDGILDGTELGVTTPVPAGATFGGTAPGRSFVPDAGAFTTTNPLKRDSDNDGDDDGVEDLSHDGRVDAGETDPNDPFDAGTIAANLVDTDLDGVPDVVETAYGLDPMDLDNDDDGVPDDQEGGPLADVDGDGLRNALDPDSDGDGLTDGVELGVTQGVADPDGPGPIRGTDPLSPFFKAAALPASFTNPLRSDTDGDGVPDGYEDLDRNGRQDPGETSSDDPADAASNPGLLIDTDGDTIPDAVELAAGLNAFDLDSDDDGIADGLEGSPLSDGDGDGLVNALDPDADGDGLNDGLEAGLTTGVASVGGVPGTNAAAGAFRADLDPSTWTNPLDPDSDGDGKRDGFEDLNGNGRMDFGETNPLAVEGGVPEAIRAQGGSCRAAGEAAGIVSLVPLAALLAGLLALRVRRRGASLAARAGRGGSIAAAAGLLLLAGAGAASAEDQGFDARTFRPTADGLGVHNVRSADVLAPFSLAAGLFYDHADNPAELANEGGRRRGGLVNETDAFTMTGAIGLPYDLQVAARIPLVIFSDIRQPDDPTRRRHGGGFGDVYAELKWLAWTPRSIDTAIGVDVFATAPTGDESRYQGEGRVTAGFHVNAEQRLWERVRLLASVGYEWLDGSIEFAGVTQDDRLRLAGGVAVMLFRTPGFLKKIATEGGLRRSPRPAESAWRLDLEASVDASLRASKPGDDLTQLAELYAGVRLDTPLELSVLLGSSFGLADGVGAAEWRIFVGVSFAFGGGAPRRAFPGFARGTRHLAEGDQGGAALEGPPGTR